MQKMFIALEEDCPGFIGKEFLKDGKINLAPTELKILMEGMSRSRSIEIQSFDTKNFKNIDMLDILDT